MSRPARGAWVEIANSVQFATLPESRPARGAWVEMSYSDIIDAIHVVAPRKGRVG